MKKITITLISLATSGILLASPHESLDVSNTDIIERLINFIIFVALLWYLVANKLKAILKQRSDDIASKHTLAQDRIKISHQNKAQALERLKVAKQKAQDIISTAKKEAYIISSQIDENTKEQIQHIIKSTDEAMTLEYRALQKKIVANILKETFESKSLALSSKDYVNIINKRVS